MKRVVTAAVGAPLALVAVFRLPDPWFFLLILALIEVAVVEYAKLSGRCADPRAVRTLLVLVPIGALGLSPSLWAHAPESSGLEPVWLAAMMVVVGLSILVVLFRVSPERGLPTLGALAFGWPYFSLPVASLFRLKRIDPWIVVLLLAVVWLGDTGAYYVGSRWGRHRLAPGLSPRKTWEGALAGLVTALLAAGVWSSLRLGETRSVVLLLALVTSIVAQFGDLTESLLKRGAGVKDSGRLLPGHGGVMDRMDAMLLAAPTMLFGVLVVGWQELMP